MGSVALGWLAFHQPTTGDCATQPQSVYSPLSVPYAV